MSNVDVGSLPDRMRSLPIDERGYPVPWFVAWKDGKPEFRAADGAKFRDALRNRLCWVCGNVLGVYKTFVVGPMCGLNRNTAEPPSHLECGRWSALNCPFLSNPDAVRREDQEINNERLRNQAPGIALSRNPGVTLLWTTRSFDVVPMPNGVLFTMGKPTSLEWYTRGRAATDGEIARAVTTGLPALEAMARAESPDAMRALERCVSEFDALWRSKP